MKAEASSAFVRRSFIKHDQLTAVFLSKLDIGIKQFNPVDGPVGRQINVQFIADMNSIDLC
jgi:hypothetical protein